MAESHHACLILKILFSICVIAQRAIFTILYFLSNLLKGPMSWTEVPGRLFSLV
jgi:hypothetical protein